MSTLEKAKQAACRAVSLFPSGIVKLKKAKDGHYYLDVLFHTPLPDYTYDFNNIDNIPIDIRYEAK